MSKKNNVIEIIATSPAQSLELFEVGINIYNADLTWLRIPDDKGPAQYILKEIPFKNMPVVNDYINVPAWSIPALVEIIKELKKKLSVYEQEQGLSATT